MLCYLFDLPVSRRINGDRLNHCKSAMPRVENCWHPLPLVAESELTNIMSKFRQLKTWHTRYKNHQIEIHESAHFVVWIAVKEIRAALPSLRPDPQLVKAHTSGLVKLDDGPRYFFTEEALTKVLTSMGSHDALHLLAALEKSVFYSARRKRGDATCHAPLVSPSVDFSNTQPYEDGTHTPARRLNAPVVATVIASDADEPISETPQQKRKETPGETLRNIWLGKASLLRIFFVGGFAVGCWSSLCLMVTAVVIDRDNYTGSYAMRQWIVLLVVLATPMAGIWWGTGMMRCTLRAHREGHHFLVAGSGFVLSSIILTQIVFANLGMAGEWISGWWDMVSSKRAATEVVHDPFLGRIVVRGEIGFGSYLALEQALQMRPKLTLVEIESPGGYVYEGLAMARLIEQNKMDTVSFGVCASACTFLLAAGQERYLGKDALIGFHRSGSYRMLNTSSWSSADYQMASYYRSRNTQDGFIRRALDTPFSGIWIPEHWEMYASGYATKRWSDRKSGY